ncbi:unnamed protein product [Lepeophtheirus salmonis]|uniref:(salmon louse) hypothetical protein n=1 Tax=Lepeophtheirus salmonis TaxID=72036 RepID=A0A7R8D3P6_LEPSM|nr:unnamed protein product [Lepeophtheirus salmonis]CAF3018684.1 unnamed protein product [Lepeophtheirus salmonis]
MSCSLSSYGFEDIDLVKKDKKALGIFSVVRFSNDPCSTADNTNGTCYTSEECSSRGGSSSGNCASGYGVCCIFALGGCGQRSIENCTYFSSPAASQDGRCILTICPCSDNICQLRLDFSTFTLSGPATATDSTAKTPAGKDLTDEQRCLMDTFSVTNPGGSTPPVICGMNNGEHMYVDSAEACNDLVFNSVSANVRQTWRIKITQYSCDFDNLAPDGCTQYFFGSKTDQRICVRRERSNCQICWSATGDGDFETSGDKNGASGLAIVRTSCCGYGISGIKEFGFDCVMIPGASKKTNSAPIPTIGAHGLCGSKFAPTDGATVSKTICSKAVPFNIRFLSDEREQFTKEKGKKNPNGFKLFYEMFPCT